MTIPAHPGSPVFLDVQQSVSPDECAWARTRALVTELKEEGGIPIDNEATVIAAHKGERTVADDSDPKEAVVGHEPASVTFNRKKGLNRIASVTCGTCTQVISVCGPAKPGNQGVAMNRPAPGESGCVIWERVPEFPPDTSPHN